MTDPLTIAPAAPLALIAVDLWDLSAQPRLAQAFGADAPALGRSAALEGGWRAIRVEPTVWWLAGPLGALAPRLAAVEAAIGEAGAAVDLSGGFVRLGLRGASWRELLTIGGVFDVEDPTFGPGRTAGTILHHVAVRYDVVDETKVGVFAPPSYADHLLHHWRDAAARMAAA